MSTIDLTVTTTFLRGTYHLVEGFDEAEIVRLLQHSNHPISWVFLVPGVMERLLEYIEANDVDTSSFATVRCTGSLADLTAPERIEQITEKLDAPFHNSYGSTEGGWILSGHLIPVGTRPDRADIAKVESPMIDVKLVDSEWNEVADKGELAVRGPSLGSGYVNNQEANEEEFQDGWFRSGDIFSRNEDGTFNYETRRKYLIKSGGENIFPSEIERVLKQWDPIEEAVVVRVPDEKWGEVPMAYVGTDEELQRNEILEFLEGKIASYKLPQYVDIVDPDRFPRGTTGKIVRADVEDWEVTEEHRVRTV